MKKTCFFRIAVLFAEFSFNFFFNKSMQTADKKIMPVEQMISVVMKVLVSPHVWGAFIVVLLYLNFVSYVQHYHKRPPPVRKAVKKQVAAAVTENSGENSGTSENAEKSAEASEK